ASGPLASSPVCTKIAIRSSTISHLDRQLCFTPQHPHRMGSIRMHSTASRPSRTAGRCSAHPATSASPSHSNRLLHALHTAGSPDAHELLRTGSCFISGLARAFTLHGRAWIAPASRPASHRQLSSGPGAAPGHLHTPKSPRIPSPEAALPSPSRTAQSHRSGLVLLAPRSAISESAAHRGFSSLWRHLTPPSGPSHTSASHHRQALARTQIHQLSRAPLHLRSSTPGPAQHTAPSPSALQRPASPGQVHPAVHGRSAPQLLSRAPPAPCASSLGLYCASAGIAHLTSSAPELCRLKLPDDLIILSPRDGLFLLGFFLLLLLGGLVLLLRKYSIENVPTPEHHGFLGIIPRYMCRGWHSGRWMGSGVLIVEYLMRQLNTYPTREWYNWSG
ncbi:hypothetical protein Taro_018718, partial [Colocasia esculenta]|nr:hypothetical protein [Colocasia esculenta]